MSSNIDRPTEVLGAVRLTYIKVIYVNELTLYKLPVGKVLSQAVLA